MKQIRHRLTISIKPQLLPPHSHLNHEPTPSFSSPEKKQLQVIYNNELLQICLEFIGFSQAG